MGKSTDHRSTVGLHRAAADRHWDRKWRCQAAAPRPLTGHSRAAAGCTPPIMLGPQLQGGEQEQSVASRAPAPSTHPTPPSGQKEKETPRKPLARGFQKLLSSAGGGGVLIISPGCALGIKSAATLARPEAGSLQPKHPALRRRGTRPLENVLRELLPLRVTDPRFHILPQLFSQFKGQIF